MLLNFGTISDKGGRGMEYSYNYSSRDMEKILRDNGFSLVRTKGEP